MTELYNITTKEAIDGIVDRVLEGNPELSRAMAKKLTVNALIYNCVIDEVLGQVDYLLGKENDYDSE